MLRMDSGSKCTWYKFIKGEQKQSYRWATLTDKCVSRRKDISLLVYCSLSLINFWKAHWRWSLYLCSYPAARTLYSLIPFICLSLSLCVCVCVCLWQDQERWEMFQPDTEMCLCPPFLTSSNLHVVWEILHLHTFSFKSSTASNCGG